MCLHMGREGEGDCTISLRASRPSSKHKFRAGALAGAACKKCKFIRPLCIFLERKNPISLHAVTVAVGTRPSIAVYHTPAVMYPLRIPFCNL